MNRYLVYIRNANNMLHEVSKEHDISIVWLWMDYLWCAIRHRTLIKQYVYSEYWMLSGLARRRGLTYHRLVKLMDSHTNQHFVKVLQDKKTFNEYYEKFIKHEWLCVRESNFEDFLRFAERHDALFIKPAEGQDGEGIRKYVQSEHQNNNLPSLFAQLQKEDAMIEECIEQHSNMAFGTKSVNTVKVTTAIDTKGNVQIMKAMLRIGIGNSVIDNLAAGGAIYDIDIEHGFVSSLGYSKFGEKLVYHPGTNITVTGFKIPNWNSVVECAINAAKMLPQIQIIGWDIAITNSGVDLIEGNHNPDYLPIEYGTVGFYKKFVDVLNKKL